MVHTRFGLERRGERCGEGGRESIALGKQSKTLAAQRPLGADACVAGGVAAWLLAHGVCAVVR